MKKDDKGNYYSNSSVYAVVADARDYEILKWEIKETYKRVTGKVAETDKKVKTVSTDVDDLNGNTPQPRVKKDKSNSKYGEMMKSGKLTNQEVKE